MKWSPINRLKSFKYAFRGLKVILEEPNLTLHTLAAIGVIAAGWYVGLSPIKWAVLFVIMAIVIGLELMNTALEKLIDKIHPEQHPEIGRVKDILAAAVLVSAIAAVFVGFFVFCGN